MVNIKEFRAGFVRICSGVAATGEQAEIAFSNGDIFLVTVGSPHLFRSAIEVRIAEAREHWSDFISSIRSGVTFAVATKGGAFVHVGIARTTQASRWARNFYEAEIMFSEPGDRALRYRKGRNDASLDSVCEAIGRAYEIPPRAMDFRFSDGRLVGDPRKVTLAQLRQSWSASSEECARPPQQEDLDGQP